MPFAMGLVSPSCGGENSWTRTPSTAASDPSLLSWTARDSRNSQYHRHGLAYRSTHRCGTTNNGRPEDSDTASDSRAIAAVNVTLTIDANKTIGSTSLVGQQGQGFPWLQQRQQPIKIRVPIQIKYALDTIYFIWGFVVTILGVALSFGLILNLMGYAYQFEPDGSFRVDTVEQLRTETQFRTEIQSSMKEKRRLLQQQQEQPQISTTFSSPTTGTAINSDSPVAP